MKKIQIAASWFTTIAIPFFLLMTAIRLLLTSSFVEVEYRLPGFPEDPYGFSIQDRLYWSKISINYLLNDETIHWLGDFELPDGSPLYNERELSHMLDVKILVQKMIVVHSILLLILLLIGFGAWRSGWLSTFGQFLIKGGWLTIGIIAAILIGIALSFEALFTGFHKIFFEGDTWLFRFSDTLIRLFPLRFWQDAFIFMGVITLAGAVALILIGKRLARKDGY
ncbi:MAG: TIGR01906 family membrane protein [Anaerolineae bacterium]|nr:TIGR01906 family membrane protein [Anaerolineae bacterium]